jgi:hypothetical protein
MSAKFPTGVEGHVVAMTRRYPGDGRAFSVATCQCGWKSDLPVVKWRELDRKIDAHWQSVSKEVAAR